MSLMSSITITFWDEEPIAHKIEALLNHGWAFTSEEFHCSYSYDSMRDEDYELYDVLTAWSELKKEIENLESNDKRYGIDLSWKDTELTPRFSFSSAKEIDAWTVSGRPKLKDCGNFTDFSFLLSRAFFLPYCRRDAKCSRSLATTGFDICFHFCGSGIADLPLLDPDFARSSDGPGD